MKRMIDEKEFQEVKSDIQNIKNELTKPLFNIYVDEDNFSIIVSSSSKVFPMIMNISYKRNNITCYLFCSYFVDLENNVALYFVKQSNDEDSKFTASFSDYDDGNGMRVEFYDENESNLSEISDITIDFISYNITQGIFEM